MIIKSVAFAMGAVSLGAMPEGERPEIAFIGRSNVGKSSLINMLCQRKNLARTSSTPGKTQEINFYLVNESFFFVDLQGFGYARVSKSQRAKWQKLIGEYVTKRNPLRIVFQLIDSRHPPTAIDRQIMQLIKDSEATPVVLLTKSDKLSGNHRQKAIKTTQDVLLEYHLEVPVILTSAKDQRGRKEILKWIYTLTR